MLRVISLSQSSLCNISSTLQLSVLSADGTRGSDSPGLDASSSLLEFLRRPGRAMIASIEKSVAPGLSEQSSSIIRPSPHSAPALYVSTNTWPAPRSTPQTSAGSRSRLTPLPFFRSRERNGLGNLRDQRGAGGINSETFRWQPWRGGRGYFRYRGGACAGTN